MQGRPAELHRMEERVQDANPDFDLVVVLIGLRRRWRTGAQRHRLRRHVWPTQHKNSWWSAPLPEALASSLASSRSPPHPRDCPNTPCGCIHLRATTQVPGPGGPRWILLSGGSCAQEDAAGEPPSTKHGLLSTKLYGRGPGP